MNKKNAVWLMIIFSLAGMLFAGFLSFFNIFMGFCPLSEPCPTFFGVAACVYGFSLFTALFILSLIIFFKVKKTSAQADRKKKARRPKKLIFWTAVVAVGGIIFAIASIYKELAFAAPGIKYTLLLPTCIYGFLMFVGIFIFALLARKK